MKEKITFCILFALNAQSLSGTQTLPGIRGGSMNYTTLNWKANYKIYKEMSVKPAHNSRQAPAQNLASKQK